MAWRRLRIGRRVRARICRRDRDFAAKFIGLAGFSLTDTFCFLGMPRIEFPTGVLTPLLFDLASARQGQGEDFGQVLIPLDFAQKIAADPTQASA